MTNDPVRKSFRCICHPTKAADSYHSPGCPGHYRRAARRLALAAFKHGKLFLHPAEWFDVPEPKPPRKRGGR